MESGLVLKETFPKKILSTANFRSHFKGLKYKEKITVNDKFDNIKNENNTYFLKIFFTDNLKFLYSVQEPIFKLT